MKINSIEEKVSFYKKEISQLDQELKEYKE